MSTLTGPIVVLPTQQSSGRTAGLFLGVASALAFSSSGPFLKPLLEAGWSLGTVLIFRMGIAGLILSPALFRAMARERHFLGKHSRTIVMFGLAAVVGSQLFFFSAMQRMPVAVALLIQYLAPVLLVLYIWARTRQAPSRLVMIGSITAMVGLVLVIDIVGARFDLLGTLFALASAICTAGYFLISERSGDDLPPLALASGGLLTGSLFMGLCVLSGWFPWAAPEVTVELAGMSVPGWLPLVWVAAVATTFGYALGVIAVPRIGSRLASFVGLSEVLFALCFAWIFLGEAPATVQFFGGILLLAGVVLVRWDASRTVLAPVTPRDVLIPSADAHGGEEFPPSPTRSRSD